MLGLTPPYHSLQEMNLDWLLTKIKNMLRFLPDDGTVGQILRRTAHGAEWSDEQGGGGGAVNSVNGQTGTVVLDASDVGALPDTTVIPDSTSDLVNDSGFITAAGAPVQSVNSQTGTVVLGKSDIGLGNVDNVQQYSASNPPPYPVTSVNSQTGAVTISVPDSTSDLINDSGFITAAGAPVQSVNGQTGAVVLPIGNPTEYTDSETTSSNSAITKAYTVNGNGYVIASVSIVTDTTSDVGWCWARIRKNTTAMAEQVTTIDTARAYQSGASVSCAFNVSNGETISLLTQGYKNGSKTILRTILAFGCTLT